MKQKKGREEGQKGRMERADIQAIYKLESKDLTYGRYKDQEEEEIQNNKR